MYTQRNPNSGHQQKRPSLKQEKGHINVVSIGIYSPIETITFCRNDTNVKQTITKIRMKITLGQRPFVRFVSLRHL